MELMYAMFMLIFLVLIFGFVLYEYKDLSQSTEFFSSDTYLKFPTKCFGCEREMIRQGLPTYLSHPTKCFSCEAEHQNNDDIHFEQNNKCFSCERD